MSVSTRKTRLPDRAAFTAAVNEVAELTVRLRALEARRDAALQAVRERHEPDIRAAADRRDALMALAEAFAQDRREELFPAAAKSGECELATFGLRLGNPTLKLLSRRWTWDTVLAAVRNAFGDGFLRVKTELDKDAVKAALGDKPEDLAAVGMRIEQSEAFWVEPKDVATAAGEVAS